MAVGTFPSERGRCVDVCNSPEKKEMPGWRRFLGRVADFLTTPIELPRLTMKQRIAAVMVPITLVVAACDIEITGVEEGGITDNGTVSTGDIASVKAEFGEGAADGQVLESRKQFLLALFHKIAAGLAKKANLGKVGVDCYELQRAFVDEVESKADFGQYKVVNKVVRSNGVDIQIQAADGSEEFILQVDQAYYSVADQTQVELKLTVLSPDSGGSYNTDPVMTPGKFWRPLEGSSSGAICIIVDGESVATGGE